MVGGGVAGLSIAWALSTEASVAVLEREAQPATQTTGRSAALFVLLPFDGPVRTLSLLSRDFLTAPPAGFSGAALHKPIDAIHTLHRPASVDDAAILQRCRADGIEAEALDGDQVRAAVPVMSGAVAAGFLERGGFHIDVAGLCEAYRRGLDARGGRLWCDEGIARVQALDPGFRVDTESGRRIRARVVINAAGAWADEVATRFGASPLGLEPLRRTMIVFDPPAGKDCAGWPVIGGLDADYYFMPDAGRLMGSAADEVPARPGDAQPEELDIARAAHAIEAVTSLKVERIIARWAGLRTFAPDRLPLAGFAPGSRDFFWFAGQGGFGIQTAPALAAAGAALALDRPLPAGLTEAGLSPAMLSPARL